MGDTLAQNGCAMPEPFLGAHEFCCKMLQITSTKVFEFASFEQIPDPFVRIEFGRIARQASKWRRLAPPCARKSLMTWQRWIVAPSQMTSSFPAILRNRSGKNRTTSGPL